MLSAFAEAMLDHSKALASSSASHGRSERHHRGQRSIYTNCWVLYVIYDLNAFVMHESVYFNPSAFYPTGSAQSLKGKRMSRDLG